MFSLVFHTAKDSRCFIYPPDICSNIFPVIKTILTNASYLIYQQHLTHNHSPFIEILLSWLPPSFSFPFYLPGCSFCILLFLVSHPSGLKISVYLFFIYTQTLGDLIQSSNFKYHSYAKDSQI